MLLLVAFITGWLVLSLALNADPASLPPPCLRMSSTDKPVCLGIKSREVGNNIESSFENANAACETLELNYWKNVQKNCNVAGSKAGRNLWTADQFMYFENARVLGVHDGAAMFAFDIVGKSEGGMGNWWTVRLIQVDSAITGNISSPVTVTGRVVDLWNGRYTVFAKLPIAGRYQVQIVLDYLKCSGYPPGFLTDKMRVTPSAPFSPFEYRGILAHTEYIDWKGTLPESIDHARGSEWAELVRYLCDVGHYTGAQWEESLPPVFSCLRRAEDVDREAVRRMTYLPTARIDGSSLRLRPVVLMGDSTTGHHNQCLQSYQLHIKKIFRLCNNTFHNISSQSLRSLQLWKMFAELERVPTYVSEWGTLRALTRNISGIPAWKNGTIGVINAGIHLMQVIPFHKQLDALKIIAAYVNSQSRSLKDRDITVVWRSTTAMHEEVFVPNIWFPGPETMKIHPWFDLKTVRGKKLEYLTDPTSWLYHSIVGDLLVKGTNHQIQYLNMYWGSKSNIPLNTHDMRHPIEPVVFSMTNKMLDRCFELMEYA